MRAWDDRGVALRQDIREILLWEWDPIGVNDIPEAEDEYDAYLEPVYSLLTSGKGVGEMFEYLSWLEHEYMGLSYDQGTATQEIAEKLVQVAQRYHAPPE
jgi:hypothetical protein